MNNTVVLERQCATLQAEIMHLLYAKRPNADADALLDKAWRTKNTLRDYRGLKHEALPFMSADQIAECDARELNWLGMVISFDR